MRSATSWFLIGCLSLGVIPLALAAEESAQDAARFLDRGDYVEDTKTGLLWQKDGEASGKRNFNQAAEYAKQLKLGKVGGWRVPTAAEFAGIFPADAAPFKNSAYTPEQCCGGGREYRSYWTSELDGPPEKDYAFVYHWYAKGGKNNCYASQNFVYVRCVREKRGATELADVVAGPKPKEISAEQLLQVKEWLKDLAHEEFKRREKAQAQLQALGAEIHSLLREALEKSTDAEVRSRLKQLLPN
jgi:hypothetical protein